MGKPIRVGFGTCEPFNEKIERHIDRKKFNLRLVNFKRPIRFYEFDIIVPLTIGEVLLAAKHYPAQNDFRFLVADPKTVQLAHDKEQFNSFLKEHGFEGYLPEPVDTSQFPFVLKRRRDSGGRHCLLIQNDKDRERWQHLLEDDDYFAQSYVRGDVEYTTHLFYRKGIQFCCTVKFKMNRQYYIRGVHMHPFKNVQLERIETPFAIIFDRILKKLNFTGTCCFNFKIVDGRPVIFELNPRFGGSLPPKINEFLDRVYRVLRLGQHTNPADIIRSTDL